MLESQQYSILGWGEMLFFGMKEEILLGRETNTKRKKRVLSLQPEDDKNIGKKERKREINTG